jgi:hypothetical protein
MHWFASTKEIIVEHLKNYVRESVMSDSDKSLKLVYMVINFNLKSSLYQFFLATFGSNSISNLLLQVLSSCEPFSCTSK